MDDRDFEIDWAFQICDMEFVRWCIAHNIHQDELKPLFKAGWMARAKRVPCAADRWHTPFQELVG